MGKEIRIAAGGSMGWLQSSFLVMLGAKLFHNEPTWNTVLLPVYLYMGLVALGILFKMLGGKE